MNVLFISPHFPPEMEGFTKGLKEAGANIFSVADVRANQLPESVRRCLSGHLHVEDLVDEEHVVAAVDRWVVNEKIDAVECLWEPFVLLAARLREHLRIPGMSVDKVKHFRDKDLMKQKLRQAGVRVAKWKRCATVAEVNAAVEEIGFPVCIKPISGAGSADTHRVDNADQLASVLSTMRHVDEANVEEFIEGEEFTFDAVSLNGETKFYSISQYFPPPLQARSYEWISPAQLTYRDPDVPRLKPGVKAGLATLAAMQMETGFTHMEWFLTGKGEAVVSEIACRNGGGHFVDMMNFANDFNVYKAWADCVVNGKYIATPQRKYHVAMVFKRAQGHGRINCIEGLDAVRSRCGNSIVWENLLPMGHPRRDWKKTLISDGFLCTRHQDFDECFDQMKFIVNELRMYAG